MIAGSFFRYCYERFSPNAPHVRAEDLPIFAPRQPTRPGPVPEGGRPDEEVEMITDFSWRNFFAVINAVKIMHKITKGNPTRVLQLVHHKTSVSQSHIVRILGLMVLCIPGHSEADDEDFSSRLAIAAFETDQEPGSLQWAKMEAA